jgi:hypothetical protein
VTYTVAPPGFLETNQIYDGDTLLGQESGNGLSVLFISPASSFPNPSIEIDFTSINDGTINGRIENTPEAGYTIDDISTVHVNLGTDDASDTLTGGPMNVTSLTVTPEPSSALALAGLFGVAFLYRRWRTNGSPTIRNGRWRRP